MFRKNKKIEALEKEILLLKKEIKSMQSNSSKKSKKKEFVEVKAGSAVMFIPLSEKIRIDNEWREREGKGEH